MLAAHQRPVWVAVATDGAGHQATSTVTVTVLDVLRPSVQITGPSMGTFLRGVAPIAVNAMDSSGVVRAELWVGIPELSLPNTLATSIAASNGAFTIPWDTSGLSPGRYQLEVRGYDAAGNSGVSTGTWVMADNDAPAVAIASPASGATVKGLVSITAFATDAYLREVVLYVDDAAIATTTVAPFTATWESRKLSGLHTLTAVATDWAGNTTTSAPVSVRVR